MRKPACFDEVVNLPPLRGITKEKFGDTIGAMQDIAGKRGSGLRRPRRNLAGHF
jgi:hypothetical protein